MTRQTEELVKDLRPHVGGNAGSGVAHRDAGLAGVRHHPRRDAHRPVLRRVLQGVGQQVVQDLTESARVGPHLAGWLTRQIVRICRERDAAPLRCRLMVAHAFFNRAVESCRHEDDGQLAGLRPCQLREILQDVDRVPEQPVHAPHRLVRALRQRAREPRRQELGEAPRGPERVLEIVRHSAQQCGLRLRGLGQRGSRSLRDASEPRDLSPRDEERHDAEQRQRQKHQRQPDIPPFHLDGGRPLLRGAHVEPLLQPLGGRHRPQCGRRGSRGITRSPRPTHHRAREVCHVRRRLSAKHGGGGIERRPLTGDPRRIVCAARRAHRQGRSRGARRIGEQLFQEVRFELAGGDACGLDRVRDEPAMHLRARRDDHGYDRQDDEQYHHVGQRPYRATLGTAARRRHVRLCRKRWDHGSPP